MIWNYELKKLLKIPFLWCLICFFLLVNTFLMLDNIIDSPRIYEQTQQIKEHGINKNYMDNLLTQFSTLDMINVKEFKEELYQYQATGLFKKFIDNSYQKLNGRLEEIRENKELDDVFYPGDVFQIHSKLYVKLLRPLLLEMAIIMILSILFLMDYERLHKTTDLVYSSYKGRTIQKTKWCCGMITGLGINSILMLITLTGWFFCVPYKGFWNTSISSVLVMENRGILCYPFITYEKMTVLEYLVASIFFCYILLAVVGILTGIIQLILKNSYFSMLLIILLALSGMYINTIHFGNWADLILSWNLSYLWNCSGFWFMERNLYDSFQGADSLSIGIQIVFLSLLLRLTYKKYQTSDCP